MAHLLGQLVRLSFKTFSDPDRLAPADPDGVHLIVLGPAGASAMHTWPGEDLVRDSLGVFHFDLTPAAAGRYEAYWASTGVVTAYDEIFYVRAPFTPGVGLADVKSHLDIDDDEDDELQFFVDVANEWVAKRVVNGDLTPTPVQDAVRELVRHLWDTQRGPAGGELDPDTLSRGLGYAIPNRVDQLLVPYLKGRLPTGSFPPAQPFDIWQWSRW